MSNATERCHKLRQLHTRLKEEVRTLEADVRQEEYDGVANPLEMVNIIKSLQTAISSVEAELAKCSENE
jgi:hypothetical protein